MLKALPTMDVAGRIPRVRERFAGAGIEALLVTRLPNVQYLTVTSRRSRIGTGQPGCQFLPMSSSRSSRSIHLTRWASDIDRSHDLDVLGPPSVIIM